MSRRVLAALCLICPPWFAAAAMPVRLEVAGRIPIGAKGVGVLLSRDGRTLYVCQNESHSVAVVDTRTRKQRNTIRLAYEPESIAESPDGKRIYIGQWGGQSAGELSVIDTSTNYARPLGVGGPVTGISVSADGATVYMAMCRAGLRKMDVRTGSIQTLYRQFCVWAIALSPDKKSIWVNFQGRGPNGRRGHDAIARFDAGTGKLLGTINGLANIGGRILISRDGRTIWVDGYDACSSRPYDHIGCPVVPAGVVHVIDTVTMRVIRTLPKPQSGTITFSGDRSTVALTGAHLLLIDARNFQPLASLAIPFEDIALSPDGEYAYAASEDTAEVIVLRIRKTL